MNWKIICAGLVLTGTIAFLGCSSSMPDTATTTTLAGPTAAVSIINMAFSPATITISAETTVVWTNNDSVAHTATSTAGPSSFDSGSFGPGSTYSHKFSTVGAYSYYCTIHPYMTGTVIVQ